MRKIAIFSVKGGVGKTTCAANLGAAFALLGKKVLLVDLDPQSNLSLHLGFCEEDGLVIENFLVRRNSLIEVIHFYSENLHVIPAGSRLLRLNNLLTKLHEENPFRPYLLRHAFQRHQPAYDFLIIDCPPSNNLLVQNALSFVEEVYLPIQCHYFALESCRKSVEVINHTKARYNPALTLSKVIPTMVDYRKRIIKEVLNQLRLIFRDSLTRSRIRENIALAEAQAHHKTIFDYNPHSHGAEDFMQLAEEILQHHRMQTRLYPLARTG